MGLLEYRIPEGKLYGVLAEFENPAALYHACQRVRDAGYTKWDAHTPFPVHGLERAMGIKASKLGWIVAVCGLSGAIGGFLLQTWVHSSAYPIVISGKPFFSWPAYIPVTFELGVLAAAAAAVFGMLGLNKLPTLFHPLFNKPRFERFSDDRFFISIEAWDPKFDERQTAELLRKAGATHVETVENEP